VLDPAHPRPTNRDEATDFPQNAIQSKKRKERTRTRTSPALVCYNCWPQISLSRPVFFRLRRHLDVTRSSLLGGRLSLQDGLSVGVKLQGSDDDVGRVDTDLDGGAVGSVLGDSLDVDDPLLSVDLRRIRD
jgi:hypothetical protein